MKEDKNIEKLVENMMKLESVQKPSHDFTSSVMQQIEALEQSKVTIYKPLISKPVWYAIGFGMVALIGFLLFGNTTVENTWLPEMNYNLSYKFPEIEFSSTMMYAMVFLVLMLGIQIPLLKNYFDKRFEF